MNCKMDVFKMLLAVALLFAWDVRAACSSPTTETFVGGFLKTECINSRYFSGIGQTNEEATSNLTAFKALYFAGGPSCRLQKSNISTFLGGYRAWFECKANSGSPMDYISGVGYTSTDTGENAYAFAELLASYDVDCSFASPPDATIADQAIRIKTYCKGSLARLVDGVGTDFSAAANNAAGFAELSIQADKAWTFYSWKIVPGAFEVRFYRSGGPFVTGTGPTMTAAGMNALTNASFVNN